MIVALLPRLIAVALPVVKDAQSLVLVGSVARSDLIKPSLAHFDEEEKRERVRGLPWQA